MKSKKIILIIVIAVLAVILVFAIPHFVNKPQDTQVPQTEQAQNKESVPDEPYLSDKIGDTYYKGRVTEITDDEITIILDETQPYTYKLTENAKKDIEVLEIAVDTRVIVNFEAAEDGTMTATSIEVITSE